MPSARVSAPPRLHRLGAALALGLAGSGAWSQTTDAAGSAGAPAPAAPAASAAAAASAPAGREPITLEADALRSTPDGETLASGRVLLRQGGLQIQADQLSYRQPQDLAHAEGHVRIDRAGAIYRGEALQVQVQDFSGWFIAPEFEFPLLGTRGQAERIDFASRTRIKATEARYTSCPPESDGSEPDWQIQARSVTLDFDANEGIATGGRLHFKGVTILALPRMSFPVTGDRKSGWLPPTVNLDSRSGFELSVPYYWNIAPNRDFTVAPYLMTRRGFGADAEFRYLEPRYNGTLRGLALPNDRVANRDRWALDLRHHQMAWKDTRLDLSIARVSDDEWWKDFPRVADSYTPRLLPSRFRLEQPWRWGRAEGEAYVAALDWQVMQDLDAPIVSPYDRRPQLGVRGGLPLGPLQLNLQTEINRFERPANDAGSDRLDGWRWHATGSLAWPWRTDAGWIVPRLSANAARYATDDPMSDGRTTAQRLIPTFSVDAGLNFERELPSLFGRALVQTLEPRLLYVRTPYRRQDTLPNFDAYGREFDFSSVYATNAFAGIDRVSDANNLTIGATSRLLDPATGAEVARLGAVQRYLFATQQVAPAADGSVDGPPLEQRFSDLLLLGSTNLVPGWALDASLQYSPEISRLQRSVVGATYIAGPYRTVSGRYRLARGISEQFEFGWQWPLFQADLARNPGGGSCQGSWYSVGRINYSLSDSRVTDSLLGFEYDAGCWIARVVAERLSTGRSEATTRLLLQLELVGLSRLGSNPLQVLKDNIPGYRLLREERDDPAPTVWSPTAP